MSSLYNSNQIQELYNRSLLYLGNSNELIKKKEFHKAGEMSWGAIVLLLKAVGLIYNYSTGGHKKLIILRKYIYTLTGDDDLNEGIKEGEKLHANFYQNFIDELDFPECYQKIKIAHEKLYEIIQNPFFLKV